MKGIDIQKIPKKKDVNENANADRENSVLSEFSAAEQFGMQNEIAENISGLGAENPYIVPEKFEQKNLKKPFKFKISYLLIPFTIIVLIAGTVIGTRFVNFARSISLSQVSLYQSVANDIGSVLGNQIPALKGLDQSGVAQAIKEHKRVNVLLLGYGGDGHSGAYLTDSIVLVSLDFSSNKVSFISVPRDTWIKIPTKGYDGSYWKINAAYELGMDSSHYPYKLPEFNGPNGGGDMSKYVVSEVVGMPVDYYISMDFSGFKKIVDTLGGVEVNVDNSFTDYSYPTSDANAAGAWCDAQDNTVTDCRYKVVHFDKGLQYMNGERALEYVRSRHAAGTEGSDFARSRRQQKLMVAIEQKAMNLGALPKIFNLMDDVQGHFQTDLSLADIKDLADYARFMDFQNAQHIGLTDQSLLVSGYSQDGQWILSPEKGMDNWNDVHAYIYNVINGLNQNKNESAQNQKVQSTQQNQ